MTQTQITRAEARLDVLSNEIDASNPWPTVVGVLAGLGGAAGVAISNRPTWNLPGALVSSALCGIIAGVGAWLVLDSWIDGRRLRQARANASFVLDSAWEARLSRQLIARYVASSLASVCGAAAAFSSLTPERVRDADIVALGWPLLAGVVVASIGAATSLTRNFQWAALLTPPSGPAEMPAMFDPGFVEPIRETAPPAVPFFGTTFGDLQTTPVSPNHSPTTPPQPVVESSPFGGQASPGPIEPFLIAPPDHSGNDDR